MMCHIITIIYTIICQFKLRLKNAKMSESHLKCVNVLRERILDGKQISPEHRNHTISYR